jgi:hypothetical protein
MLRCAAGLALIFLTACASNPAAYDLGVPAITKIESRRLPPETVARRVFDQVADVLTATPQSGSSKNVQRMFGELAKLDTFDLKFDSNAPAPSADDTRHALERLAATVSIWPDPTWSERPHFSLSQMAFMTPPHATATPGLCVTDPITVFFRPVGGLRGPWMEVRANNVMVEHYYYFLAPPRAPVLEKATDAERAQTYHLCAQLDPNNFALYFTAPDDAQAVRGAWLVQNARLQMESGHPTFTLDCSKEPKNWQAKCLDELRLSRWQLAWISDCAADAPDCNLQIARGFTLTITTASKTNDTVVRVVVEPTVVIADSIAD